MLVRQPIDPTGSARADTLANPGMLPKFGHTFGRRGHHAGAGYRPVATRTVPDSCAPTSIAELAEVLGRHVGPRPDTIRAHDLHAGA